MTDDEILRAASGMSDLDRNTFLDEACAGDEALRRRVQQRLNEATSVPKPLSGPDAERPTDAISLDTDGDGELTLPSDANSGLMPSLVDTRVGLLRGQRLGPFELQERLGRGGMGEVWRARQQEPVRRDVALKVIRSGIDSDQILSRFAGERQALALMNHPNIANILDVGGADQGKPYFVMELVVGKRLTDFCDEQALSIDQRLRLFLDICSGVQHAHQKGIIHRDLKPSNILVMVQDGKPVPKIIDFGLAKALGESQLLHEESAMTSAGQIVGTLKYMSPEQATADAAGIDTRTDIYALGVILYELLTGSTPLDDSSFKGRPTLAMLEIIRDQDPVRPSRRIAEISEHASSTVIERRKTDRIQLTRDLVGDLDWIVMKALDKDRGRRYESASGFGSDIRRFLNQEPVLARPPSIRYRSEKFIRKHRAAVAVAAMFVLTLIVGVAGTGWGLRKAIVARDAESVARQSEKLAREKETEQRRLAESKQADAERAAVQERLAREESGQRLQQIQMVNDAVFGIFEDFDIQRVKEGPDPVESVLGNRLAEMGRKLNPESINDRAVLAGLWSRLGRTLTSLGRNEEAIEFLEDAYEIQIGPSQATSEDALQTLSGLAAALRADGRNDKAMPIYQEVYHSTRAMFGDEHPETLNSLNSLAISHGNAGNFDQAITLLEEVLAGRQEVLGEDHLDTLGTMRDMATGYLSAGKPAQAVPWMEKALQGLTAKLGENHTSVATTKSNLAAAYEQMGQREKALPMFEEAFRSDSEQLGRDHPTTLRSLNNLAYCHQQLGQTEKSLELYEEMLSLCKSRFGDAHPQTAAAIGALGGLKVGLGQYEESLPLLEEAVRLKRQLLGDDDPKTISSVLNLGATYRGLQRYELALENFQIARTYYETKWGANHPSSINALNNVAATYLSLGRMDQSIELFELVLEKTRSQVGEDHPALINYLNNLGAVYIRTDQRDRAVPLLEQALRIQRGLLGDDHPATIKRIRTLASVHHQLDEFEKAIPLLELAVQQREEAGDAVPDSLGPTLLDAYLRRDEMAKADEWAQRLLVQARETLAEDQTQLARQFIAIGRPIAQFAVRSPERLDSINTSEQLQTLEQGLRDAITALELESPVGRSVWEAQVILGTVLVQRDALEEAEALLTAVHEGITNDEEAVAAQDDSLLRLAIESLIQLHTRTDQPDERMRWESELSDGGEAD